MSTAPKARKRHMDMARAYLAESSSTRGNWEESARAAGFSVSPPRDSGPMAVALERIQAEIELVGAGALESVAPEGSMKGRSSSAKPTKRDSDVERLEALLGDGDPDWDVLGPVAKRVLTKVGIGSIESSPGQVTALREVLNRAEAAEAAKRKQSSDPLRAIGVVVLPTLRSADDVEVIDLGEETDAAH